MIKVYQKINARRNKDGMDVNSLTMFGEAWDYQQNKIDRAIAALERSKPLMMKKSDAIEALKILKGGVND